MAVQFFTGQPCAKVNGNPGHADAELAGPLWVDSGWADSERSLPQPRETGWGGLPPVRFEHSGSISGHHDRINRASLLSSRCSSTARRQFRPRDGAGATPALPPRRHREKAFSSHLGCNRLCDEKDTLGLDLPTVGRRTFARSLQSGEDTCPDRFKNPRIPLLTTIPGIGMGPTIGATTTRSLRAHRARSPTPCAE